MPEGRKKYLKQLAGGMSVHGNETRITVLLGNWHNLAQVPEFDDWYIRCTDSNGHRWKALAQHWKESFSYIKVARQAALVGHVGCGLFSQSIPLDVAADVSKSFQVSVSCVKDSRQPTLPGACTNACLRAETF